MYVKGEYKCVKGECMYVKGECMCVREPEWIMSCTAPHTLQQLACVAVIKYAQSTVQIDCSLCDWTLIQGTCCWSWRCGGDLLWWNCNS